MRVILKEARRLKNLRCSRPRSFSRLTLPQDDRVLRFPLYRPPPPCSPPSKVPSPSPNSKRRSVGSGKQTTSITRVARQRVGGRAVCVLRRPADGQRHAPPGPLPDPGDQGPVPPLQDDARLPLRTQGGLGHARPAGRGRGLQGAGHPLARKRSRPTASSRSSRNASKASGGTCRSGNA